jgi:hypothetical protein
MYDYNCSEKEAAKAYLNAQERSHKKNYLFDQKSIGKHLVSYPNPLENRINYESLFEQGKGIEHGDILMRLSEQENRIKELVLIGLERPDFWMFEHSNEDGSDTVKYSVLYFLFPELGLTFSDGWDYFSAKREDDVPLYVRANLRKFPYPSEFMRYDDGIFRVEKNYADIFTEYFKILKKSVVLTSALSSHISSKRPPSAMGKVIPLFK